jgi:hypothetical protein
MPTFTIDENAPILVEFKSASGVVRTAATPQDLTAQSEKAITSAMNAIHGVAQRVAAAVDALTEHPSKEEVDFALKLTAEAGALVASARTEAGFNVKFTLERKEPLHAPKTAGLRRYR